MTEPCMMHGLDSREFKLAFVTIRHKATESMFSSENTEITVK